MAGNNIQATETQANKAQIVGAFGLGLGSTIDEIADALVAQSDRVQGRLDTYQDYPGHKPFGTKSPLDFATEFRRMLGFQREGEIFQVRPKNVVTPFQSYYVLVSSETRRVVAIAAVSNTNDVSLTGALLSALSEKYSLEPSSTFQHQRASFGRVRAESGAAGPYIFGSPSMFGKDHFLQIEHRTIRVFERIAEQPSPGRIDVTITYGDSRLGAQAAEEERRIVKTERESRARALRDEETNISRQRAKSLNKSGL